MSGIMTRFMVTPEEPFTAPDTLTASCVDVSLFMLTVAGTIVKRDALKVGGVRAGLLWRRDNTNLRTSQTVTPNIDTIC